MKPGEINTTIVGNLPRDPEVAYTPSGAAVAKFSVGVTPRSFDKATNEWKDGETSWVRCVAWRKLAENIAASLHKGNRVIVTGRFAERKWKDKDDNDRSTWELTADAVGPELTFAEAEVRKVDRSREAPTEDPWASSPPSEDEAPF